MRFYNRAPTLPSPSFVFPSPLSRLSQISKTPFSKRFSCSFRPVKVIARDLRSQLTWVKLPGSLSDSSLSLWNTICLYIWRLRVSGRRKFLGIFSDWALFWPKPRNTYPPKLWQYKSPPISWPRNQSLSSIWRQAYTVWEVCWIIRQRALLSGSPLQREASRCCFSVIRRAELCWVFRRCVPDFLDIIMTIAWSPGRVYCPEIVLFLEINVKR